MTTPIFCCASIEGFKNRTIDHEDKFRKFLAWAKFPKNSELDIAATPSSAGTAYAIQVVRQVNYGPIDFKRYFLIDAAGHGVTGVSEKVLIDSNFQKLNT